MQPLRVRTRQSRDPFKAPFTSVRQPASQSSQSRAIRRAPPPRASATRGRLDTRRQGQHPSFRALYSLLIHHTRSHNAHWIQAGSGSVRSRAVQRPKALQQDQD
ncbi:hypothetical protein VHUM_04124 [Vanrija humicola]|uniref:Uncharacterized protein n=1 Tax=Vanrija humicola TaxID=5417 RepID=A0A7D8UXD7_VANHU|nr:hypothetical protein VHUM_04124 [Vanrija humicola]